MNQNLLLGFLIQGKKMLILKHLDGVLECKRDSEHGGQVENHHIDLATTQRDQVLYVNLLVITLNPTMNSENHQDLICQDGGYGVEHILSNRSLVIRTHVCKLEEQCKMNAILQDFFDKLNLKRLTKLL